MALERTILTLGVVLFTLALASVAPATPAQPGPPCALRAQVVERLGGMFGETRRAMGLGANNAVVEVFANADNGSWSITVTMPNGLTCLVASGQAFETMADLSPPGKGA